MAQRGFSHFIWPNLQRLSYFQVGFCDFVVWFAISAVNFLNMMGINSKRVYGSSNWPSNS